MDGSNYTKPSSFCLTVRRNTRTLAERALDSIATSSLLRIYVATKICSLLFPMKRSLQLDRALAVATNLDESHLKGLAIKGFEFHAPQPFRGDESVF